MRSDHAGEATEGVVVRGDADIDSLAPTSTTCSVLLVLRPWNGALADSGSGPLQFHPYLLEFSQMGAASGADRMSTEF